MATPRSIPVIRSYRYFVFFFDSNSRKSSFTQEHYRKRMQGFHRFVWWSQSFSMSSQNWGSLLTLNMSFNELSHYTSMSCSWSQVVSPQELLLASGFINQSNFETWTCSFSAHVPLLGWHIPKAGNKSKIIGSTFLFYNSNFLWLH